MHACPTIVKVLLMGGHIQQFVFGTEEDSLVAVKMFGYIACLTMSIMNCNEMMINV